MAITLPRRTQILARITPADRVVDLEYCREMLDAFAADTQEVNRTQNI
ncbi:MAG TPA: hypothetical protein VGD78_21270 [Chthoniobacterales bacterium]